jgi:hypothetical protein
MQNDLNQYFTFCLGTEYQILGTKLITDAWLKG